MKKWICGWVMVLVIVLGWFWPFWLKGKIPVAIDIPVAMYYPWLNYSYGYEVRPPVKNPILTDTISQFWIWRNWAIDGLKDGQIKIWSPYSFSGYTMSPWFQSILFSPLNFFYWITDDFGAMSFIVISQFLIGLIAAYLLGRQWFKSRVAAWFLAVAWVTSSYFVGWSTWGTVSLGLAIMPLGLYFAQKSILGMVATEVILVLSGHPQTIGYVAMIWALWFLIEKINIKKVVLVGLLAAGLTAVVWWPSVSIIRDSSRMNDNQMQLVDNGFANPARAFLKIISVNFFGNPGTNNYWGGGYNFHEELVNFGTVTVVLLLTFFIFRDKKKKTAVEKLGLWSMGLGVLLSFKYPLGFLVYLLKIPLMSTSPAGRGLILVIFGGVVVATQVVDKLMYGVMKIEQWKKLVRIMGLLTGIVGMGLTAYYLNGTGGTNIRVAIRNVGLSTGFIILTLLLILGAIVFRKMRYFMGITLVLLLVAENYLFFRKYTPFVETNLYFPKTKVIEYLMDKSGEEFFRVERETGELFPPNMWQIYGFYSTSGYDPVNPKNYSDYLISRGVGPGYSRYIENGTKGLDEISGDLAIKYLLALRRNKNGDIDVDGELPNWVDQKKWKWVMDEGPVVLLENREFKKVYRWENETNDGKILLVDHKDDYWRFETESGKQDVLVLAENWAPGWKVKVDGEKVKIEKWENSFKSVEVPGGKHEVEFYYENDQLKTGGWISLLSLMTAAIWGVVRMRYMGRK